MADDQGWGEMGYNGHPHLKTPVFDEMAARGWRRITTSNHHAVIVLQTTCSVLIRCNGEGGIRTRGTRKEHTGFRNRLDKPLRHLSKNQNSENRNQRMEQYLTSVF